ncbi:MAG: hypothetical protein U1F26_11380 [Lysobacterales bacterium]
MWGTITYEVLNSGAQVKITADAVSASTNAGQGFGYVIDGTTKDGPHFHSGIYDFDFTDPSSHRSLRGIGACQWYVRLHQRQRRLLKLKLTDPPTSVTYDVSSSGAQAKLFARRSALVCREVRRLYRQQQQQHSGLTERMGHPQCRGRPDSDGIPDTLFLLTESGGPRGLFISRIPADPV